jgi:hypothetical protein
MTIAHSIRRRRLSSSLFKRLSIEFPDTDYHRRQLLSGHVAQMPFSRAPRKILTCWVDNRRPLRWPQMNCGRVSYDIPSEFFKWREIAPDRNQWR